MTKLVESKNVTVLNGLGRKIHTGILFLEKAVLPAHLQLT